MSDAQSRGPAAVELKNRFAILGRVAIFFTLSDNVLRALARAMRPVSETKGATIIRQGDWGDAMYVIEEGRCEVTVDDSPGHTVVISILGPGDFFGEMALIAEEPRTATIRALEDCRLLVLDRATLYTTFPADSDALLELNRLVEQRRDSLPNLISRAKLVAPSQAAATVAVYSPKGGAGRTTIAVNLTAALALKHPGEVLLVDLALPYNHAALISALVPTGCLALVSQVPEASFEEALLSSILHHPGGMMLLPGVLKPEHADLINSDLISRAMTVLSSAFRYIVFDLGVVLNETTLTVLEHAQRIVLVATPELSSLKDITDVTNIFTNVLKIVPGRLILIMNSKMPRPVVGREDVERTLKREIAYEFGYDGSKPDEAAVKGEILVLTDPRSAITRGAQALAQIVAGIQPERASARRRSWLKA
ncbi:MAG TPA: cyclic nucleotide-binding domain-containing protein [Candidatus Nitrosotalea sp.]|nr:cyclic nucleotide-binding domain-containing protein [Candidatus Nitrosotalea sp.]